MTTTSASEPSAWRSLHLLKMMLRQIAAYSASLPALTPMPSLYKNAPTIQVRDACVSALVGRGCGLDSVLFFLPASLSAKCSYGNVTQFAST